MNKMIFYFLLLNERLRQYILGERASTFQANIRARRNSNNISEALKLLLIGNRLPQVLEVIGR